MRLTEDFQALAPSKDARGMFNLLVPGTWYKAIAGKRG
jgi:hypothetical protein